MCVYTYIYIYIYNIYIYIYIYIGAEGQDVQPVPRDASAGLGMPGRQKPVDSLEGATSHAATTLLVEVSTQLFLNMFADKLCSDASCASTPSTQTTASDGTLEDINAYMHTSLGRLHRAAALINTNTHTLTMWNKVCTATNAVSTGQQHGTDS